MAMKNQADLRFMKDGVVFGPTDRAGLEKLLAAGRITTDDRVSVRDAAWMRIGEYLAAPPSVEANAAVAPVAPASKKKGDLKVLAGGRVVSSLHRDEVERLKKAARVKDDDLICALGGPWMRVGDFFAPSPPAPVAPTAPAVIEKRPAPVQSPIPIPVAAKPMPLPLPTPQPADDGYRVAAAPQPTSVSDEWFVRVRGVHSAPLKKHHVEALFQASEITLDNVARHPTWPDNDWRPIRSIAALADISRP